MSKSNLKSKTSSSQSINIRVIKPSGIFSFWNWFIPSKNKQVMKNLMANKNVRLKLNSEELETLKRNGIDLQKLQNIAANKDNKVKKNFIILSKGRTELNKNELRTRNVLSVMNFKTVSKKTGNFKRSLESCSSVSVTSKHILGSNITYINSKKSSKSIINTVNSKASLKVGLKSNGVNVLNNISKSVLMKDIPSTLLRGNIKKNVFVPIYVGKKKSKNKFNGVEGNSSHKVPGYQKGNFKKPKKNKANPSFTENSFNNTDYSFRNISDLNTLPEIINNKIEITNVKDILENTENILEHQNSLSSNMTGKPVFAANPNIGCDVMLKLFETLCKTHEMNNKTSCENTKTDKPSKNIISNSNQNIINKNSKLDKSTDPSKEMNTLNNSCQGGMNNEKYNNENTCSKSKNNDLGNLFSTVTVYRQNHREQTLVSRKSLLNLEGNDQSKKKERNHDTNKTNHIKEENKFENEFQQFIMLSHNKLESPRTDGTKIKCGGLKTGYKEENEKSLQRPTAKIVETINNNKLQYSKNEMFHSFVKTIKNDANLKFEENSNLKAINPRQIPEDQPKKHTISLPVKKSSNDICNIYIEQTEYLDSAKLSGVEFEEPKVSLSSKREPKLSITILVKNNFNEAQLRTDETTINSNNFESRKKYTSEVKDGSNERDKEHISNFYQEDWRSIHQSLERNYSFEKYKPSLRFETNRRNDITVSPCFCDFNHLKKDKGLNTHDLKGQKSEFGLEGVAYLNQKQRQSLDAKILKSVSNKISQELVNITLKPEAFGFIDLNENYITTKHLVETSLGPNPMMKSSLYAQTNFKPNDLSSKTLRKSPSFQLECLKDSKEPDFISSESVYININNLLSTDTQSPDHEDSANMNNNGERFNNGDIGDGTTTSPLNTSYFDEISKELIENEGKNDQSNNRFIKVFNEELTKPLQKTVLNSTPVKKRNNRYHMTLNQECILEVTSETPTNNKMSIGDHKRNTNEAFLLKDVIYNEFTERFQKSINGKELKTPQLAHKVTSQSEMGLPNCRIVGLCIPVKARSFPYVNAKPNKNITIDYGNLFKREGLSDQKLNSKLKSSLIPGVTLSSLTISEMIKCCPCILEKVNATESFIRSQAEILLEKSDKNPNISIVCNTCVLKSECWSSNIKTKNSFEEISNKPNLDDGSHQNSQNKAFVGRCEVEGAVQSKVLHNFEQIESIPQLIEIKSKPHLVQREFVKHLPNVEKKISCRNTCLLISSNDSLFSDISENKLKKTHSTSTTSDFNTSNKHNLDGGMVCYSGKINETYSLTNLCDSTTVFQHEANDVGIFCKIVLDGKLEDYQNIRDNNSIMCPNYKDKSDSLPPKTVKFSQEDIYRMGQNMSNISTRRKNPESNTQNYFETRNIKVTNFCSLGDSAACHGIIHNRRHQLLAEKNKASWIRKIPHKIPDLPSQIWNSSTNHTENFHHHNGYDLMNKNGDSIFSCSIKKHPQNWKGVSH